MQAKCIHRIPNYDSWFLLCKLMPADCQYHSNWRSAQHPHDHSKLQVMCWIITFTWTGSEQHTDGKWHSLTEVLTRKWLVRINIPYVHCTTRWNCYHLQCNTTAVLVGNLIIAWGELPYYYSNMKLLDLSTNWIQSYNHFIPGFLCHLKKTTFANLQS